MKWNKPSPEIWRSWGVPPPEPEFVFHPTRKWRLDFAWVEQKVALEVHGGRWIRGRHTRGAGQREDWQKISEAQMLGWVVLQMPPEEAFTTEGIEMIRRALEFRGSALKLGKE